MNNLVTAEALSWIGRSDPPVEIEVNRSDIIKYSISTEQLLDKYLKGDEAPPMFVAGLSREIVPLEYLEVDGLPKASLIPDLPLKRVMAGGVDFKFFSYRFGFLDHLSLCHFFCLRLRRSLCKCFKMCTRYPSSLFSHDKTPLK